METVLTVITAFGDGPALARIIALVAAQARPGDMVFVCDNSRAALPCSWPGAAGVVFEREHHPENPGTAGAVGRALARGLAGHHPWIWTLDQDSQPQPGCLDALRGAAAAARARGVRCAGVFPRIVRDGGAGEEPPARYDGVTIHPLDTGDALEVACDAALQSGSLLATEALARVPSWIWDLFLDWFDIATCLQLRRDGGVLLWRRDAVLLHELGRPETIRFRGRAITYRAYSPARLFLSHRNRTLMELRFADTPARRLRAVAWSLRRLWDMQKLLHLGGVPGAGERAWATTEGTLHGLLGGPGSARELFLSRVAAHRRVDSG